MERLFQGVEYVERGKKGDRERVPITDLTNEGDGKIVGLYFSAEWCPPCRAFTPDLADWYTRLTQGRLKQKLEIVFVSSDKNEEKFDEYYDTMPWLALPYQYRDRKIKLAKKFKVSGIPTLILLDSATGKVSSRDGRSLVMNDPNGEQFPWKPVSFLDIIPGEIINNREEKVKWEHFREKKYLGLYFSAEWCPPCKLFTPQLVKFYTHMKAKFGEDHFEIVFLSSDRTLDNFHKYFSEMPWYALPFGDKRKEKLSQLLNVSVVPTLVIINVSTGAKINDNGRIMVTQDEEGEDFPWYPKSLYLLSDEVVDTINDRPCAIWFTDGSEEEMDQAKTIMKPIADEYFEKHREEPEDSVCFIYTNDSELSNHLVETIVKIKTFPRLVLVDIPDQKLYTCEEGLTEETVRDFITKYEQEELPSTPLKQK